MPGRIVVRHALVGDPDRHAGEEGAGSDADGEGVGGGGLHLNQRGHRYIAAVAPAGQVTGHAHQVRLLHLGITTLGRRYGGCFTTFSVRMEIVSSALGLNTVKLSLSTVKLRLPPRLTLPAICVQCPVSINIKLKPVGFCCLEQFTIDKCLC